MGWLKRLVAKFKEARQKPDIKVGSTDLGGSGGIFNDKIIAIREEMDKKKQQNG